MNKTEIINELVATALSSLTDDRFWLINPEKEVGSLIYKMDGNVVSRAPFDWAYYESGDYKWELASLEQFEEDLLSGLINDSLNYLRFALLEVRKFNKLMKKVRVNDTKLQLNNLLTITTMFDELNTELLATLK